MDDSESLVGSIVVFIIAIFFLMIFVGIRDNACREKYGQNAELHGTRDLNECKLNNEIKPL